MKQRVTLTRTQTVVVELDCLEPYGKLTIETNANGQRPALGGPNLGQITSDTTTPWKMVGDQSKKKTKR